MEQLRVFTFAPGWGLPTVGPFALKLLAWLDHHEVPYRQVVENRSDRGPLGKSPWIEQGSLRMGDSDAIIRHLAAQSGMPDPTQARSADEVCGLALKIAFEERFHQILEWELFVHPEGRREMRLEILRQTPPILGPMVFAAMARHFRRQLNARGIARLEPGQIAAEGRRLLDALALRLEAGGGWLGSAGPSLADFAVWGQVAPMLAWPMATPTADHAKSRPVLIDWHGRMSTGKRLLAGEPSVDEVVAER